MILDTKSTFDALVERYAPRRGRAQAHPREPLLPAGLGRPRRAATSTWRWRSSSSSRADERFDLVVLDTPPTRHALDFLEAPDRLMSFLDTSILRFFLKPYFVAGRLTLKVATRTGRHRPAAWSTASSASQFLQDLSEFFLAFEGMYDGFKERAARVHALLRRRRRRASCWWRAPRPPALERGALLPPAARGEGDAASWRSS